MAESFIHKLQQHSNTFTPSQRALAGYIVDHVDEIGFASIGDLAERAGVSEATVVRFARKLGFDGYPDLKQAIQQMVMEKWVVSQKLNSTLDHIGESGSILQTLIGGQIEYFREVLTTLTDDDLIQCSQWMIEAPKVFIWGEGSSATPVVTMAFWLDRFGLDVHPVHQTGRRIFDSITKIGAQDALVAFAFRRESPEVNLMFDWGQKKGARSILITDAPHMKMASAADKVLVVKRGPMEVFRSMAVPVAVADALVVAVARARSEKTLEALRRLDELREHYGYL